MGRLALYTTVYPGVERYLSTWYESVVTQTDTGFDIWIAVDELTIEEVRTAVGQDLSAAKWVIAAKGDSPAQIRERAIAQMIDEYPAVVFVDSDDLLEPTRMEAARRALQRCDVNGCAMRVIDEDGSDLDIVFEPPDGEDSATILPRNNVFGLSNTVYRSETLRQCLPIPSECVLVDWFLITRAWNAEARLSFDRVPRMAYRQHAQNTARILPLFTQQQVLLATDLVLDHYKFVLNDIPELQTRRRIELENEYNRTRAFSISIRESTGILRQYVDTLNRMPSRHIWWSCVAHPELEEIWRN